MPDAETRKPYLDPAEGEVLPEKKVSPQAYQRLSLAADAIAATKRVIGNQGNQIPALKSTKLNSAWRLQVMRDSACWEYASPVSQQLAAANPEADVAAKAELAHGGNCGEHASLAFHHLRLNAAGQQIQSCAKSGLDHAFVIIGDIRAVNAGGDKSEELAVADAWPNNPTACLWVDHFAFVQDRKKIAVDQQMVADGKSFKDAIGAGLRLSAKGQAMITRAETEAGTDQWVKDNEKGLWDHDDSARDGRKYAYKVRPPKAAAKPAVEGPQPDGL